MSSYIGPAFLYKDNATLEDIESLVKELAEVRKDFVPFVAKMFTDEGHFYRTYITNKYFPSAEEAYKKIYKEHDRSFINDIKKDTSSWENGHVLDIMCNVVVYIHKGKIVIHGFASREMNKFFKTYFNYPDYSYWDIYAGDEEITEEMEEKHSEVCDFYDSLFENTSIPSNVGLAFDFYTDDVVYDIEEAVLDELFGKDWEKPFRHA